MKPPIWNSCEISIFDTKPTPSTANCAAPGCKTPINNSEN